MSSEVKSGIGRRDAIATIVGGLVAASAAPARAADAKAKPILLYCDLKVDPGLSLIHISEPTRPY